MPRTGVPSSAAEALLDIIRLPDAIASAPRTQSTADQAVLDVPLTSQGCNVLCAFYAMQSREVRRLSGNQFDVRFGSRDATAF